jgi:hypothetical protein
MSALLLPEKCVLTRVAYAFWLLISLLKLRKETSRKPDPRLTITCTGAARAGGKRGYDA